MLSFIHIQAIIVRMLISLITNNTASINETLRIVLRNEEGTALLWNSFGVTVYVEQDGKGRWFLGIRYTPGFFNANAQSFKPVVIRLGSESAPINKRVINDLSVWFHANLSAYTNSFYHVAENGIAQLDIRPFITEISLLDRFLNKPQRHELSLGNSIVDKLIQTEITVTRSLFNRLVVTVSVSSKLAEDSKQRLALEKDLPVFTGVLRQFVANVQQEPVNDYVRQAIIDHIEFNLK